MTVTLDESSHSYRDGERRLPSVTQIIREVFQVGSFGFSLESRQRGDAVHKACQLISLGTYDEAGTHPLISGFATGWRRCILEVGYVSTHWEVSLGSKFGFAGRPDTWGVIGSAHDPCLCDVKSGSLPSTVGIQLAAYDMLIRENFPDGPQRFKRRAVRLEADGKYTLHSGVNLPGQGFTPFDSGFWDQLWLSALNCYLSGLLKVQEAE